MVIPLGRHNACGRHKPSDLMTTSTRKKQRRGRSPRKGSTLTKGGEELRYTGTPITTEHHTRCKVWDCPGLRLSHDWLVRKQSAFQAHHRGCRLRASLLIKSIQLWVTVSQTAELPNKVTVNIRTFNVTKMYF